MIPVDCGHLTSDRVSLHVCRALVLVCICKTVCLSCSPYQLSGSHCLYVPAVHGYQIVKY